MVLMALILLEVSAASWGRRWLTANAFRVGFHRVVHRACRVPLKSIPRVTRYGVFSAVRSVGERIRASTALR